MLLQNIQRQVFQTFVKKGSSTASATWRGLAGCTSPRRAPLYCQACLRLFIKPSQNRQSVKLFKQVLRSQSSNAQRKAAQDAVHNLKLKNGIMYISSLGIVMLGAAYAGVPLYRMFCAATGLGGNTSAAHDASGKIESLAPVKDRIITVTFVADTASSMQWNFKPQQHDIKLYPGETALAFYTAKNPTNKPIIGISTYSVIPFDAGQYFNKIQCFCFEEQILNPHEEVDMPVFFYIDPEYATNPRLEYVDDITLSYTFFEAKDGMSLPVPGYAQSAHSQPTISN